MRKMPWRAVASVAVAWFFLVAGSCSGPSRDQSISSASGFQIFVTADPNTLRAIPPGSERDLGACSVVTAKVFNSNGQLVDGATVFFATTLGSFRVGTEDFGGRTAVTVNGLASVFFCALEDRGSALITATVEDASDTVIVTIF